MLIIVPYVYAAVSVVKVIADQKLPATTFRTYKWLALAAVDILPLGRHRRKSGDGSPRDGGAAH